MTSRARRAPGDGLSHEGHLLDANNEPVDGEREITTNSSHRDRHRPAVPSGGRPPSLQHRGGARSTEIARYAGALALAEALESVNVAPLAGQPLRRADHNRLPIESRRGCLFCPVGMITRQTRRRSLENARALAQSCRGRPRYFTQIRPHSPRATPVPTTS